MSHTMNLYEFLLNRARRYHLLGQTRLALATVERLCAFPDLPPELAAEAHGLAGDLHLRKRAYRLARRHLIQSLRIQPSARYHLLMGLAHHHDPRGDEVRAARHYARSLRLDPRQSRCLGEAGLLAIARGEVDRGLERLRRGVELSPDDPSAVRRLIQGACQAGRFDLAWDTARAARFASPKCPRIRQLWEELQLARLRRDRDNAQADCYQEEPVLLPFVRLVRVQEEPRRRVRTDGPAALPGPHLLRIRALRNRRRAP